MALRKFIAFGKLLALLLLFSSTAVAKPLATKKDFHEKGTLALNKAEQAFHKNMLQPQVVHVSTASEDSVKPITPGYAALLFHENAVLLQQTTGQANEILQDADRCESVSKLLFPFHYFW